MCFQVVWDDWLMQFKSTVLYFQSFQKACEQRWVLEGKSTGKTTGSAPSSQRQSSTASALLLDLRKSYLWQYHSPWHREHLFAASLPQDPHFGFSGSKLSITSKLYVWANLVKKHTKTKPRLVKINKVQMDGADSSVPSLFKLVFSVIPLCLQLQVTFRWVESFFHLKLCYCLPLPRILSQNVVPYFRDLYIR